MMFANIFMKKIIILYCVLLFLVVFYPLFISTGYIFALDQMAYINYWEHCVWDFNWLASWIDYTWCFLKKVLPDFMHIRLLAIMTFGLLMTWGYYLTKETKNIYAILFCITLLCINPFFYGRIMDGQVNVFVASALFVWFVYFLKQAFRTRLMRYNAMMVIIIALLFVTSIYALYLAVFSYVIFFGVYFISSDHKKKLLLWVLMLWLVVNMFWFISPWVLWGISTRIDWFTLRFSTASWQYTAPINAALMRWYWWETQHRFVTLEEFYKHPGVGIGMMTIIWMCVIFGIISLWRKKTHRSEMISICIMWIVGYILTLGIDLSSPFRSWVRYLYDYFPLYSGFRESQKWGILLVIAYAYLWWYGIQELFSRMRTFRLRGSIMIFLITLPLISTPLMLFGFIGQLQPKHFPREYSDVRDTLHDVVPTQSCENLEKGIGRCYTFLYFPWHEYIRLGWVNQVTMIRTFSDYISNTDYNLIGDNSQIGPVWSTSIRPESLMIERFIRRRGQAINPLEQLQEMFLFQETIKKLGVQYIVVFRDSPYSKDYIPFLDMSVEQWLLDRAQENRLIKIYKIL